MGEVKVEEVLWEVLEAEEAVGQVQEDLGQAQEGAQWGDQGAVAQVQADHLVAKEVSWMHLEVKVEEVLWEVLEVTDQENKILHVADKHVENVLYSKVKTLIKMG